LINFNTTAIVPLLASEELKPATW